MANKKVIKSFQDLVKDDVVEPDETDQQPSETKDTTVAKNATVEEPEPDDINELKKSLSEANARIAELTTVVKALKDISGEVKKSDDGAEQAEPDKPAESTETTEKEPVALEEPKKPAEPVSDNKEQEHKDSAKEPDKASDSHTEPVATSESPAPEQPAEPEQKSETPAEPEQPAKPNKPVEPKEPVDDTNDVTPAEPNKPSEPEVTAEQTKETKHTEPEQPAEPDKLAEPEDKGNEGEFKTVDHPENPNVSETTVNGEKVNFVARGDGEPVEEPKTTEPAEPDKPAELSQEEKEEIIDSYVEEADKDYKEVVHKLPYQSDEYRHAVSRLRSHMGTPDDIDYIEGIRKQLK